MERDRGGGGSGPLQLLGVEHHRRRADGAHHQREHADDPSRDAKPTPVVARLQSVRAQPGHIRPDGGPYAALPFGLLLRFGSGQDKVVVLDEIHPNSAGVSGIYIQHHCDSSRQVSRVFLYKMFDIAIR